MPLEFNKTSRLNEIFESVFKQYYSRLCAYAARIVGDSFVAEEIVEEVFCQINEDKEKFLEIEPLKPYLYKMVFNSCMNYLKHEKVIAKHKSNIASISDFSSFSYTIDDIVFEEDIDNELLKKVEARINELPEQCQQIFRMRKLEGMSHEQIARVLNISKKTIETQITRAMKKIRENLCIF